MAPRKQSGHTYADKGRRTTSPSVDAGEVVRGAGMEVLLDTEAGEYSAEALLKKVAYYDEGWLRVVSHDFGSKVYYKFKFSRGRFAGSYVFYRDDASAPTTALLVLLGKIEGVYAGAIRPTPDTTYNE